jgi:hypothetical protein
MTKKATQQWNLGEGHLKKASPHTPQLSFPTQPLSHTVPPWGWRP